MVIRKQTITAQVVAYILDLIKKGHVKPGERLPTEKQLTEELSVSRTCVREAIKSLESLHLISVRPAVQVGGSITASSPGRCCRAVMEQRRVLNRCDADAAQPVALAFSITTVTPEDGT